MMKYYPYKSDKTTKKYYIITNQNKKVYFGAAGYSDFPTHKDEACALPNSVGPCRPILIIQ